MNQKAKTNLFIDILLFIVFLIVYEEKATGTVIHEWLGVGLGLFFIIHIILHWRWLTSCTKKFLNRMNKISRLNYILDILIYFGFSTIIFTGLMISESFLPTFGINTARSHFWQEIHFVAVDITLFLTAFHFALHWKWIAKNCKCYIIDPLKGGIMQHKSRSPEVNKPGKSAILHFSNFTKVGLQVTIILALSGLISLGWYAASATNSAEPNMREFRQNRENNRRSGSITEYNRGGERLGRNSRGRHNQGAGHGERGHHEGRGFTGIDLLRNLLIFTIVTFVVVVIGNYSNSRKRLNQKTN